MTATPTSEFPAISTLTISRTDAIIVTSLLSFAEAVSLDQFVYVSVPITGGERLYRLAERMSVDPSQLSARHPRAWSEEVLMPNTQSASALAAEVRRRYPHASVVNPAAFHMPGASQDAYNGLWTELVRRGAFLVTLDDGWAYSMGARIEAYAADQAGIPVQSAAGRPLSRAELDSAVLAATQSLNHRFPGCGFTSMITIPVLPEESE